MASYVYMYVCVKLIMKTKYKKLKTNVCEYKLEFKNQRHKPTLLATPLFASNNVNFVINRALLII